jgi:hypothetical protein
MATRLYCMTAVSSCGPCSESPLRVAMPKTIRLTQIATNAVRGPAFQGSDAEVSTYVEQFRFVMW